MTSKKPIIILLAVVILGAIAFAAYKFYTPSLKNNDDLAVWEKGLSEDVTKAKVQFEYRIRERFSLGAHEADIKVPLENAGFDIEEFAPNSTDPNYIPFTASKLATTKTDCVRFLKVIYVIRRDNRAIDMVRGNIHEKCS